MARTNDTWMGVWMNTQSYDYFWDRSDIELKFCAIPRRCHETGKLIWLKQAYKATRVYTGPGEPEVERRWVTTDVMMVKILKGEIRLDGNN